MDEDDWIYPESEVPDFPEEDIDLDLDGSDSSELRAILEETIESLRRELRAADTSSGKAAVANALIRAAKELDGLPPLEANAPVDDLKERRRQRDAKRGIVR